MSMQSHKRSREPFERDYIVVFFLFTAVSLLVFYRVQDYDFFWHIANGKAMVQQGKIINEEIFSYTRQGTPFSNHEWLAQIIFYMIFSSFGPFGIVAFKTTIVVLIAFLLYKTARFNGANISWSGLLMAVVILVGILRYRERPEIFSLLLFSLTGFLLSGYSKGRQKKETLYIIPVILVLWDFLHGAVYGIIYLLSFVIGETIKSVRHRSHPGERETTVNTAKSRVKTLWGISAVSVVFMMINPYGLRTYDFFAEFLRKNPLVLQTSEFSPPSFALFPDFWIFIAVVALLTILFAKKTDLTHVMIMIPFAALSIKYTRAIPFFGLVSVHALSSYAHQTVSASTRWSSRQLLKSIKVLPYFLVVIFIVYTVYIKFIAHDNPLSFGYKVNEKLLPVGATHFIAHSGLKGNMYNPGYFGGYLAYYLYPERKIFYYNHHIVFGNFPVIVSDPGFIEKYRIEYAILDRFRGGAVNRLFTPDRWALLYYDNLSVVVAKKNGINKSVISRYGINQGGPAAGMVLQHSRQ